MTHMWDPSQKYSNAIASEEDISFADALHKFVNEKVMPHRRDLEGGSRRDKELAERTFRELTTELVGLGVQKAFFPQELGGLGLTSRVTSCIIAEELARGDIGLATATIITPWAFSPALITKNRTVLEKFGRPFCGSEPRNACLAMTEPAGGCNIEDPSQCGRTIKTIADLNGDEWVINGQKLWASGAGVSEIYVTICTTDPQKGDEGITIIYVPKGSEGLSFGEPEEKMGLIYTDVNSAIFYDNVRVPKEYCCGLPGGEGATILRTITNGRLEDGPIAVGAAQASLEIAIEHTGGRFIKDKAVREQSLHAGILGEMAAKIQAARSSYMYVASMLDRPEVYGSLNSDEQIARVSAVKIFATQVAIEVIHKVIELMGSYGYSPEYHVEKYLRDIIIVRLWLGGPQLSSLETARGYYSFDPW